MGLNGVGRVDVQLGSDQELEERSRSVKGGGVPLGDDEPLPFELNEDGSATVELPSEELGEVSENEDGSATVVLASAEEEGESEFGDNLAKTLEPSLLSRLAEDALDAIDRDKNARAKRDEQYAEGIKRTGLGNEAPGGAEFTGASRAVHPVLIEGCIDFAARAMRELFPAKGPVKAHIVGKATKGKVQRAERKTRYMNWQTTTQIAEYRRELEVLLTQLPLGGGQYMKAWYDSELGRIRVEFVPIDDLLLPFESTSLASASRVTHVQRINEHQFRSRVSSGLYVDIPELGSAGTPEESASAEAAAKVEGKEDPSFNEDGIRVVYEQQVYLDLEDADSLAAKGRSVPYILTVDEPTGKVLGLYRNWEQENKKFAPQPWIVEFPFIPWRGAYPIGLAHIIGSLSGAATGALRALLDSAHINNMPGGLKLKGARSTGQNISVGPTELVEIDAGPGVDDIRKLVMPLPFNPPSTVLFQLLEWLTNAAKGVVGTAEEKIADANSQMPVGTALALIEQGSITFSSIHARLHAAQKELLTVFHRLNGKHLSDKETVEELGELVTSRSDFQGPMDIEPVSDPNIFSDAQRYAQLQAVMQLSAAAPQFYKGAALHKRALQLLKVPEPDEVLAVPADPEELDPVEENTASADPLKTLKAYEDQDHVAHIRAHIAFMSSPLFGGNPLFSIPVLPALLNHCREHMIMLYNEHAKGAEEAAKVVAQSAGKPVSGSEADALALADQEIAKLLAPFMPAMQQAAAKVQQLTQGQQQQDPRLATAAMKQQSDQARLQFDQQALQATQQLEQMRLSLEKQSADQAAALEQMKEQRAAASDAAKVQLEQQAAQMAQQAAQMEDALERWQTQVEMLTAQHNAHMAADQGSQERELKLELQQLVGQQKQQQQELQAQLQGWLEELKASLAPKPTPTTGD